MVQFYKGPQRFRPVVTSEGQTYSVPVSFASGISDAALVKKLWIQGANFDLTVYRMIFQISLPSTVYVVLCICSLCVLFLAAYSCALV